MRRLLAFPVLIAMSVTWLAAQELPKADDSFDVEPPLLIQADGSARASATSTPIAHADAEQLAKQLERAKRSAASAEHLYKVGVLAKVEAEQRALRVVRLEADFTKAQLAEMKEHIASQGASVQTAENEPADREAAKIALAQAITAAQTADSTFRKAELEAAILNLHRQQRLLAVGSARKADVARAEEKLATLQRNAQ